MRLHPTENEKKDCENSIWSNEVVAQCKAKNLGLQKLQGKTGFYWNRCLVCTDMNVTVAKLVILRQFLVFMSKGRNKKHKISVYIALLSD